MSSRHVKVIFFLVVLSPKFFVDGGTVCPILTPPQGTEVTCYNNETGFNGNCSIESIPNTLAKIQCQPYYKSIDGTTERHLLCGRIGRWKKERRYGNGNFSCHLDADGFVEKLIHSQKVLIFGKSTCIYCQETKGLFDHLGETYFSLEMDHLEPYKMGLLKDALYRKTGMRSWPNVFVNGQHVGGNDATKAAYKDGRLFQLLGINTMGLYNSNSTNQHESS